VKSESEARVRLFELNPEIKREATVGAMRNGGAVNVRREVGPCRVDDSILKEPHATAINVYERGASGSTGMKEQLEIESRPGGT
jgi:hypothetical protein